MEALTGDGGGVGVGVDVDGDGHGRSPRGGDERGVSYGFKIGWAWR